MLFFQLSILRRHILGHIVIGMLDMPLELFAASGNGILNNNIKIQIHVRFEATRAGNRPRRFDYVRDRVCLTLQRPEVGKLPQIYQRLT